MKCCISIPSFSFQAVALEMKWDHTEKEKKISNSVGIRTHDLRNRSPMHTNRATRPNGSWSLVIKVELSWRTLLQWNSFSFWSDWKNSVAVAKTRTTPWRALHHWIISSEGSTLSTWFFKPKWRWRWCTPTQCYC